jgi:transposase
MGKKQTYSDEYKQNAVEIIKTGKSISAVARDLGVTETSLRRWVGEAKPPIVDKDARIAELEQENKRLRQDLKESQETADVLKKSLGIFIKR